LLTHPIFYFELNPGICHVIILPRLTNTRLQSENLPAWHPRKRQREGIELAKKAGVYKGRKPSLTPVQVAEIRKRVEAGEKKATLAAEYRISRQTLYTALA